jgi:transmembrane sensor
MNEEIKLTEAVIQKAKLFEKYLDGNLSLEERATLDEWISESPENRELFETLTNKGSLSALMKEYYEAHKRKDDAQRRTNEMVFGAAPAVVRPMLNLLRKLSVAAAVILLIGVGGYLWYSYQHKEKPVPQAHVEKQQKQDAPPGKYSAMLTLADGSKVALDSTIGRFVQQGDASLVNRDGKLSYEKGKATGKENLYNTLSTSRGEMYVVTLSDGTKVWLNSASSIYYPVIFSGSERKVVITGEVYFEVAKNPKQPFIAEAKGMEVEVLGTHFNINGYADEPAMKTTLLEGKVRVRSADNTQLILAPGEQATLRRSNDDKAVLSKTKDVEVEEEVAWRFGYFQFVNADLKTVMRQLERWYDVQVVYQGKVSNDLELIGKIPRSMNLSKVLDVLQTQQVHFKLEGRKVVVVP